MIMNVKSKVALRLIQICEGRGIKPNELAALSGVAPSTVQRILSGQSQDVQVLTVKKFCDGLGISLLEFFDSEEFR